MKASIVFLTSAALTNDIRNRSRFPGKVVPLTATFQDLLPQSAHRLAESTDGRAVHRHFWMDTIVFKKKILVQSSGAGDKRGSDQVNQLISNKKYPKNSKYSA